MAGGFLGVLVFTEPAADAAARRWVALHRTVAAVDTRNTRSRVEAAEAARPNRSKAPSTPERIEDFLQVDPMEIEIGVGLIRLADPKRGGDLLDRVQRVRQNVAAEIGIIMPKVRIRDNMRLEQHQYRIKIADVVDCPGDGCSRRNCWPSTPGRHAARSPASRNSRPGAQARGRVDRSGRSPTAEMFGYTVVEPAAVLATHSPKSSGATPTRSSPATPRSTWSTS